MSPSNSTAVVCRACGHAESDGVPGARCGRCHRAVTIAQEVSDKFADDQMLGTVIGGKYGIISILGVGGFGCVYEAVQEPVGRKVALNAGPPSAPVR